MFQISLLLFLTGIIICYYGVYKWKNATQRDIQIEKENQEIKEENEKLNLKQIELKNIIENLAQQEIKTNTSLQNLTESLSTLQNNAQNAFLTYCDNLENNYYSKEEEYDELNYTLENSYNNLQDNLRTKYLEQEHQIKEKILQVQNDLDKLKNTRAAAIEAQLKEEEIKKQKDFYSLNIPENDLKDAKILKEIEYKLNNPRVLRMLIWSSFYQKPMTQLCNNITGINTKTGIYKITNQKTNLCYIGQAIDIADRWKKHAKCGLGIDTPVTNKLYQNMQEYGLENFTFEIIEECSASELNSKEKYYIELYQADKYGLNSKGGNK